MPTVILDNGAGSIKAGVVSDQSDEPRVIAPNCVARVSKQMEVLVADQVGSYMNGSLLQYNRPFDRGYLNNWQPEIDVWTRILCSSNGLAINPADCQLVMTEAPFTPESLQNDVNEVVFEDFRFQEYVRKPSAWFSAYEFSKAPPEGTIYPECSTVIDSGFSFSYIMPFRDLRCQKNACKRVNIGGKLLTNYLKEVVSYRQWNMMDEFKLMDQVKEELCYVSTDFLTELKCSKIKRSSTGTGGTLSKDPFGTNLRKFFVLPDFQKVMKGFVKEDDSPEDADEQLLTMETERFAVPEVLFNPSDVGIEQAGIAEATWQSLNSLDTVHQGLVATNVLLTGGNTKFPQFEKRFFDELRPMVPDIFNMETYLPEKPDLYAWKGAKRFAQVESRSGELRKQMVSRAEYLEQGHHYCNRKFAEQW